MIFPGKIRGEKTPPPAVHKAFESWSLFVMASREPTAAGMDVIPINYEILLADFFDRLMHSGGTVQDIKWLIGRGIMAADEMAYWDAAYVRNVVRWRR
jgi:hypothetical protein